MSMDLDKLSHEVEQALDRARELAEGRREALIGPAHLLAVLATPECGLAGVIRQAGGDLPRLARIAEEHLPDGSAEPLALGRRATADEALRTVIERAFAEMGNRGADVAEPVDCLLGMFESGPAALRKALAATGLKREKLLEAAAARRSTQATLGKEAGAASMLEKFGRDLTAAARDGQLMPVIGRDAETAKVIETILRKTKSNPLLVGDPGTGKTAVVEALAQRIASGDAPESLRKCRLISLDLTAMVAGAKYRGEFEERIKGVVDEVRASRGAVILFLDEIHTLVGAGGSEGGMDAANILKPALARGELRCVGATTFDEYRERIEKQGALARRFELVQVDEPDEDAMLSILRGIRPHYEAFHGVRLGDDALDAAIKLSRRYLRTRFLPDKAIDVIDAAAARIRAQKESKPAAIDELERRIVRMRGLASPGDELPKAEQELAALLARWESQKKTTAELQTTKAAIEEQKSKLATAEAGGDIAAAAEIRYGAMKYLDLQREDQEKALAAAMKDGPLIPEQVGAEHIAEVVAERAGIPITRMLESERERLLHLEDRLGDRVYGQEEAVLAVAEAVRRMRTDLQVDRKPTSFLFVGPTGVGKTEMAKALAECLFDDDTALIRIDMGEYKDKTSVAGLIGSRPGLVGSDEGGFLTEKVRRSPYSVVLFDEVEKGAPEVLDLLLGVLDEGRLSDAKGRFCDFTNTMILFTSNLGVREAMDAAPDSPAQSELILEFVKAHLRPEFFNRLSQVIVFQPLTLKELERIVNTYLDKLRRKLREDRNIGLNVSPEAVAYLAAQSLDPAYGARPVGRTMQREVLSPMATAILSGQVNPGQVLEIRFAEGEGLQFAAEEETAAAESAR